MSNPVAPARRRRRPLIAGVLLAAAMVVVSSSSQAGETIDVAGNRRIDADTVAPTSTRRPTGITTLPRSMPA